VSSSLTSAPQSAQVSDYTDARLVVLVYSATSFLSAFLLFQVQLILNKYILPWFGGSAAIWITSMLVFQILLLGGYVYSHEISRKLSPRAQSRLHLGLLTVGALLVAALSVVWPSAITPSTAWRPGNGSHPVWNVAVIILLSAGAPFFILSTTSPLLQRWFARRGSDARTYRLYSVSNLGSLLGLLAFPFVVEPAIRMHLQGIIWSGLFCVYILGCGWCTWKAARAPVAVQTGSKSLSGQVPGSPAVRLLWFLLPACASSLLLATTNLLCQEVISLPLLWVVPLSVYLLSFVLCFDHPRWYRRDVFNSFFALGIFLFCVAMIYALRTTQVIVLPILLFVACMICHGELVRLRPGATRLTSFYLTISAGSVFGGIFVAVLAPRMFEFFSEFQLSLVAGVVLLLCCLYLDSASWLFHPGFGLPAAIAGGTVLATYVASRYVLSLALLLQEVKFYPIALLASTVVLAGAYLHKPVKRNGARQFRFVQPLVLILASLSVILLYRTTLPESTLYSGKRNFYGALRIYELAQGGKALFHGHTLHGAQLDPPNSRLPLAYYGPDSGIGIFLRNHPKRRVSPGNLRVGVVGLGAGTLAAYGLAGDYFRYYEINHDIVELSTAARPAFTYIRDSAARVEIAEGDGRLLLETELSQGKEQRLDVLVLDAFSGDAVPVHLLTREAFDTYWQHVNRDNGVIAVHVSSRHINLLPVLEGVTRYYHGYSLVRFADGDYPFLENLWVFIARHPQDLLMDGLLPNPPPLRTSTRPRLWTDDYSDIFRLLY